MEKNPIAEQYNKTYCEQENAFGGTEGQPEELVATLANYLKKGSVLDLGAGQGRNSLWLASKGFEVVAIEISSIGAEQIRTRAEDRSLKVAIENADIANWDSGEYEAVVSTYVLHHLSREKAPLVIKRMQEHTKVGGYNVVTLFMGGGCFAELPSSKDKFYPGPDQMRNLYRGWEIIQYTEEETRTRARREDGVPIKNMGVKLLARKK